MGVQEAADALLLTTRSCELNSGLRNEGRKEGRNERTNERRMQEERKERRKGIKE